MYYITEFMKLFNNITIKKHVHITNDNIKRSKQKGFYKSNKSKINIVLKISPIKYLTSTFKENFTIYIIINLCFYHKIQHA